MSFNFDEWRAARTKGGPRTVTFCGRDWKIPADMPWVVGDFFGLRTRRHLALATRALFGDPTVFSDDPTEGLIAAAEQFDAFVALKLSEEEVAQGILDGEIDAAYATPGGSPSPNSGGSTGPSSTSMPSEPTSNGSTAGTSKKRSSKAK